MEISYANKKLLYIGNRKKSTMRIAPVYELIKSLSDAELKALAKRSESPRSAYLTLLGIMQLSSRKDEAYFQSKFNELQPGVNYTETKSYLYKFLLRHLTEINHSYNPFTEINYSFVTAEILQAKGLPGEAVKILESAHERAEEEGYHQLSVVALKRMKNIVFSNKVELRNKEYDRIQKMEQEAAAKDEESRQAMMLYSSSHAVFVAAHLSDKPLTAALEKIVRHPLIKNRKHIKSAHARLIVFDLITNYYKATGKRTLLIRECQEHIKAINPKQLTNPYYAYRYIFVLHNLINKMKEAGQNVAAYEKMLAAAPTPDQNCENYKQLFMLQTRLHAAYLKQQDTAAKVSSDLKALLQKEWIRSKPLERISVSFMAIAEFFKAEKYDLALNVIMPLWHDKKLENLFPLIYMELNMFLLAALYEQKEYAMMEPYIRGFKYSLNKNKYGKEVYSDVASLFVALYKPANQHKALAVLQKIARTKNLPKDSYFLDNGWLAKLEKKLLLKRNLK